MPNIDCVHNSDLYMYPDYSKGCECNPNGMTWGPPVPPPPFPPCPPPGYPFPPYWPPFPPVDPVDPDEKKDSKEAQICKLSKKAAAINRMLENLETKKKDVIIKVGDTSFNFGNIDATYTGWEDGSYAATVKRMLEHQRGLIQEQIKTLADELDDEAAATNNATGGTETAVTG